ncbi:MAG: DNA-deoxyinosine glycosylase [Hyphomicrobiaceae bacterium]|nr:DNA-deoxyinosine glycosylase [Hyphomicrobiaceae bacterium]
MADPAPKVLSCFGPVTRPSTRVLILGSLPGEVSLQRRQYYAHPQNQFWRLLGAVVGQDLAPLDYDVKLSSILDHGIGLWDTVAAGTRARGSLDTDIVLQQASDLSALVMGLPQLRAIAFNGKKSAQIGRPQLENAQGLALLDLPSSSPAHASKTFTEKLEAWSALRQHLQAR